MSECYLCSDPGSVEFPLVECAEEGCSRLCCRLHRAEFDGSVYCLHHQGQKLLDAYTSACATIQSKISDPPELASFDDVESELLILYGLLCSLTKGLISFHDNVNRAIKERRLYA